MDIKTIYTKILDLKWTEMCIATVNGIFWTLLFAKILDMSVPFYLNWELGFKGMFYGWLFGFGVWFIRSIYDDWGEN